MNVFQILKNNFLLFLLTIVIFGCTPSKETPETARKIHDKVITMDTHVDINVKNFVDTLNYSMNTDTQVNLPKMKAGGLDAVWFIVYTGQSHLDDLGYEKALENAMAKFDAIHRLANEYGNDQIEMAWSADDVLEISKKGKKVALIGVENAYPLGLDTANVGRFYKLGARYISLAHNGHSQFSDSNTGEYDDEWLHNGISELGKQVIERMNYYGIMVDISHPSKEAIRQTIQHSKAPVIASHSSARALSDHPRNLDDEQLEWIKENGGVVQTVALHRYLNQEKHEKFLQGRDSLMKEIAKREDFSIVEKNQVSEMDSIAQKKYNEQYSQITITAEEELKALKQKYPPVNVSDLVDHIDYIKNKIGIAHVGISSDFDGGGGIDGWEDASETFNVTLELVKRGYSEKEIEMIWNGNLLRVFKAVEEKSKELRNLEN